MWSNHLCRAQCSRVCHFQTVTLVLNDMRCSHYKAKLCSKGANKGHETCYEHHGCSQVEVKYKKDQTVKLMIDIYKITC